jgi:phage-related protein (TIGR01555 family)
MAGRIVNVRPKPGFLMDGAGEIIPARANVVPFYRDRLSNVLTGLGTSADPRVYGQYATINISAQQAEASYRGSWLVRKIVDVPPFDMTREGRDWQAGGSNIEALEKEEKRLRLWSKLQRAMILSRLYGGAALILGANDGQQPDQPINAERVKAGGLSYVHVMSRQQLSEGAPRTDIEDPWFGHPDFFTISGANGQTVKLHPSRVVAFVGQPVPEGAMTGNGSWFWGDPIMQAIGEAVDNANLAQGGFATLISRAAVDVYKFKDLMSQVGDAAGEERIKTRVALTSQAKSSNRAIILDTEDEWQQVQISWSGIPDVLTSFLNVVAGAADIPVTRLLGQSPKGLQSTGDGEERDYLAMIRARQCEMLGPALDRIDDLLIRSALGSRPPDVYYEFAPLRQMDEKDAADIETKYATALKTRSDTGEFQGEVLAKAELNRMVESGRYPGLEAAIEEAANEGAADPAEMETDPSALAATDPADPNAQPNSAPPPQPTGRRKQQPPAD